ncbi:MAG: hypothetical protein KKB38_20660 [Gammaproteobacteria bacterium]|nr:hypothetical protein [Gammaproteobacteria bacterium]
MHAIHRGRVAFALKCKPAEVPESDEGIKKALELRRKDLKEAKLKKVKDG